MIAYKLFRIRKDGSIGPLFIHRRLRIPTGEWLDAEAHPTKGFAVRPGWHCCRTPHAPHLTMSPDRRWFRVRIQSVTRFERPASQGGTWLLAGRLKVLGPI